MAKTYTDYSELMLKAYRLAAERGAHEQWEVNLVIAEVFANRRAAIEKSLA